MAEKKSNSKDSNSSQKNKKPQVEIIALWITITMLLVSVLSQASSIVNSLLQFDSVYKQLYPLLNFFHLFVLFYIVYQLQNVKHPMPVSPTSTSTEEERKEYFNFRFKLRDWIIKHFGKTYWGEMRDKKNEAKKEYQDGLNRYIDDLIVRTNSSMTKIHKYFLWVFVCFILLYIFELINSFNYDAKEPVLHVFTVIFNNIATLFWFYIYITLNIHETQIEITDADKEKENGKIKRILKKGKNYASEKDKNYTFEEDEDYTCSYRIHKWCHEVWRRISFAKRYGLPNKFKEYEKDENNPDKDKKYSAITITKLLNWKIGGLIVLIVSIVVFGIYIYCFITNDILQIEKLEDSNLWYYKFFKVASMTCVLLGGCAMFATFSRLSSGFKKVPLGAFLIMILYAALQPLFFAEGDFGATNMKIGQLMFIANLLLLLGKFGLLYLITWLFGEHRIAYYFIAEKIVKDKSSKLQLEELFPEEEKINQENVIS